METLFMQGREDTQNIYLLYKSVLTGKAVIITPATQEQMRAVL